MGGPRRGPYGDIAQLGERRLCKPEAAGSSPAISTRFERRFRRTRAAQPAAAVRRNPIDLRRRVARCDIRDGPAPATLARRARSLTTEYETLGNPVEAPEQ